MFYKGTLQEGISTAVGQQKLVLCFVTGGSQHRGFTTLGHADSCTDEKEESQTWEDDFLKDETVRTNGAIAKVMSNSMLICDHS